MAAVVAPSAQAGYPVQPSDGRVVNTLTVSFLVAYETRDILPFVFVSRSNATSADGTLFHNSGYVGLCSPRTPFGEPEKYSCDLKLSEGTYYWQFEYQKYECVPGSFGVPLCTHRNQVGPVWRFDVKLAVAPIPPTVPIMGGPSSRSRVDPLYSKIASSVSGKSAQVFCWNAADWNSIHVRKREEVGEGLEWVLGYVWLGSVQVNLAPAVCSRLDLLTYARKRPRGAARIDFAEAVDTLAHESIHVAGISNEAITECYSLQYMDYVAMRLGTNYAYARDMTLQAWNVLYRLIPATYRTSECYNGGPLDLLPRSDVWP